MFQTLQVVGGDYDFDEGTTLLKKLIIRRLTTSPGEFFHLPAYGLGFRVKRPVSPNDLPALQKKIEEQVLHEPDVASVKATLTMGANGILNIQVKVVTKPEGQHVDVSLATPLSGNS